MMTTRCRIGLGSLVKCPRLSSRRRVLRFWTAPSLSPGAESPSQPCKPPESRPGSRSKTPCAARSGLPATSSISIQRTIARRFRQRLPRRNRRDQSAASAQPEIFRNRTPFPAARGPCATNESERTPRHAYSAAMGLRLGPPVPGTTAVAPERGPEWRAGGHQRDQPPRTGRRRLCPRFCPIRRIASWSRRHACMGCDC